MQDLSRTYGARERYGGVALALTGWVKLWRACGAWELFMT